MSIEGWRSSDADADDSASPRDLADLARAGYVILRQPYMQVTFEVHHIVDKPGYLVDYLHRSRLGRDSTSSPFPVNDLSLPNVASNEAIRSSFSSREASRSFGETLTSGARGLGLVIVTRAAVGVGSRRQYIGGRQPECEVDDDPIHGGRIFRGIARPNPTFMYETAWRFEGLICIEPSPSPLRTWHCRMMREIINTIAGLAAEIKSPILSLQSPAQIPPKELMIGPRSATDEENTLTPASSLAIRFTIAIQNPSADLVMTLSTRLEQYCQTHGLGLWLADTRLGSRQGNWRYVCAPNSDISMPAGASRHGSARKVKWCIPVTLVGPARVGSTHALTTFLSRYGGVGIASCSAVSLDDLLFIHLDISIPDINDERSLQAVSKTQAQKSSAELPAQALARMLERVGHGMYTDPHHTSALLDQAGDYRCLIGPARQVSGDAENMRMAIWFSWQTRGLEPDLATPLNGLFDALKDVRLVRRRGLVRDCSAPNIEYLVCRNSGNSILRGRGKLSVPRDAALARYPDNALESRPTNLCVSLEEAWRARMMRSDRYELKELTVAWREPWLGHWALVRLGMAIVLL
jgi:hypothetical protein